MYIKYHNQSLLIIRHDKLDRYMIKL